MPVVNANSVDPDQILSSAASNLGLHSLPMSHLWDARYKWVNDNSNENPQCVFFCVKNTYISIVLCTQKAFYL